jgi:hypothetical protein
MSRPRLDVMSVLDQWEPNRKKGLAANAASLLEFAARKKPKEAISWSWVTKCVVGGKMQSPDSKIVVDMMGRSTAIRKILGRDFNRGLVSIRGHGVRATTDSDDYANTQLRKDATKYEDARQKLVASHARVDPKTMKDKDLRRWVEHDISKVLAAHNDRLAQLLLPPGEEGKDEDKGKK